MRTDTQVIHSDDIGEIVGDFYGIPINSMRSLAAELREQDDAQIRARASLGTDPVPAEIMAGEIAKDNLIRRETTSEVIGEKFYAEEIPEGQQVPIDVAQSFAKAGLLITWRPANQDFAVIHEEGTE
jgi:hypothetical protein